MNKSFINDDLVKLLSDLTGRSLSKNQLTDSLVFTAALIVVLVGVIFADGDFHQAEKENLKKTIDNLFSNNQQIRKLSIALIKEVIAQKIYRSSKHLLCITHPLSPDERLLLIALGYQMSASDECIHESENKYLRIISERLKVDLGIVDILDAFVAGDNIPENSLLRLQSKLAPENFYQSGQIFIKAANYVSSFLNRNKSESTNFKKFKNQIKSIELILNDLLDLNVQGIEKDVLSKTTVQPIKDLMHRMSNEYFRVAVVGEFSQGKSTLLNAWIGEEIQAVRAIPCSGCVTVLRYGEQKRLTCIYKDGTSQEISFDEYEKLSTIDEDAALGNLSQSLAVSNIDQIILEHPSLSICKDGLEIVDSPGLNEHPDRTNITEKLLDKTDALIFLTNATRSLTEKEQGILKDLSRKVNNNSDNQPAQNIFVVANFFDLLKREQDKIQAKERVKRLTMIQNQIIVGENRLHFLSAQAALDAKISDLSNQNNEHIEAFENFIQSLEYFLTQELGSIKLKKFSCQTKSMIESIISELEQFQDMLTGKIALSKENTFQVLEIIGDISGSDVLLNEVIYELNSICLENLEEIWEEIWNAWVENLGDRITENSFLWHSASEDKQKIMQDYAEQFVSFISEDCRVNLESKISEIVEEAFDVFDAELDQYQTRLQQSLSVLDADSGSQLLTQLNAAIEQIESQLDLKITIKQEDKEDGSGFLGWGGGALVGGLLVLFTGGLFLPLALGGVAGGILGLFFSEDPREKVIEKGISLLNDSSDNLYQNLVQKVCDAFEEKQKAYQEVTKQAIAVCAYLLSQQKLVESVSQESLEIYKSWITDNMLKLKRLDQKIHDLQNSLANNSV